MKNIVIAYKAGSCGDFLSIPFIATQKYYSAISHHTMNDSGRMVPHWNDNFLEQFPKQRNLHHYSRDWSNDLDMLSTVNKPWLILCSDSDQSKLIKNYFNDAVHLVTINYGINSQQFVFKSFCNQVLDYPNYLTKDDVGEKFLNVVAKTPQQRQYFLDLSRDKKLGQWYYDNVIQGYIDYPREFYLSGDTEIFLDNIFVKSRIFKTIRLLDSDVNLDAFEPIYDAWLQKQDIGLVEPTERFELPTNAFEAHYSVH